MRSRVFLAAGLTVILFSCQTMQAQVRFGIKAGVNIETQSMLGQLWTNQNVRAGFIAGGTLEFIVNDQLSFQTELDIQQKGEKINATESGLSTSVINEFNYVTVPLLIKGNFNDELSLGDKWNIFGYTGPYYGYLFSAKNKLIDDNITTETDIINNSDKNDWGFIFGGGVSYNLSNHDIIFCDLRYDMGLNEIYSDDTDIRNKVISMCIGYRF
ncbi:MAG: porin family protein [Bacteroidales bacterium]|jgi:hypothetical protein|nr:porin family protein [Bacteroidales bacterium]